MLKKLMYCAVVPVLIVLVSLYAVNEYCIAKLDEWYPSSGVWHLYNNKVKDQGLALLNLSVKNHHMIALGTSELNNSADIQVISTMSNFYPNQDLKYEVDIVGGPGAETLVNTIRLGAIQQVDSVPVVFNSSMTWFGSEEYAKKGIEKNLSELQYYKFINNPAISNEMKAKVSHEVAHVVSSDSSFNELYVYSKLYSSSSKSLLAKTVRMIVSPYYFGRICFLSLRDNINSFKLVRRNRGKYDSKVKQVNWEKDYEYYTNQAKSLMTGENGGFYFYDTYWHRMKNGNAKVWIENHNKYIRNNYSNSKEYIYHTYFLEVAREVGAKPLTVLCAANGYVFDYYGLTHDKRITYFKKMAELQTEYALPYIDTQDLEYEPYAFRDDAHFSSKGWFEVNREITKRISELWK